MTFRQSEPYTWVVSQTRHSLCAQNTRRIFFSFLLYCVCVWGGLYVHMCSACKRTVFRRTHICICPTIRLRHSEKYLTRGCESILKLNQVLENLTAGLCSERPQFVQCFIRVSSKEACHSLALTPYHLHKPHQPLPKQTQSNRLTFLVPLSLLSLLDLVLA